MSSPPTRRDEAGQDEDLGVDGSYQRRAHWLGFSHPILTVELFDVPSAMGSLRTGLPLRFGLCSRTGPRRRRSEARKAATERSRPASDPNFERDADSDVAQF